MKFTIGTDPEVFITKDGKITPCVGIFDGTKDEPYMINEELHIQEDNVLFEFNVRPAENEDDFTDLIRRSVETVREIITEKGYGLSLKSVHEFPYKELSSGQALSFGCSPDFNAYTYSQNPCIEPTSTRFRTAGGHICIGTLLKPEEKIELVRWMDVLLACRNLSLEESGRRSMYGFAGSFRETDYGIEYRTMSNYWIFSELHLREVYRTVESALELAIGGEKTLSSDFSIINNAINTHNIKLGMEIYNKYSKKYKEELCLVA